MSYLLIPGAGGAAWYWHRVAELLGMTPSPSTCPATTPPPACPSTPTGSSPPRDGAVVLVAQSLGAFSALPAVGARSTSAGWSCSTR